MRFAVVFDALKYVFGSLTAFEVCYLQASLSYLSEYERREHRGKSWIKIQQSSDVLCIFRDRRHQDIHLLSVIKSPAQTQKPARLAPTCYSND